MIDQSFLKSENANQVFFNFSQLKILLNFFTTGQIRGRTNSIDLINESCYWETYSLLQLSDNVIISGFAYHIGMIPIYSISMSKYFPKLKIFRREWLVPSEFSQGIYPEKSVPKYNLSHNALLLIISLLYTLWYNKLAAPF